MKTIKFQVSWEAARAIVNSVPCSTALDIYPGVLLDNFTIDLGESGKYKLGRKLCRRYIVGKEVYLNEWSSGIEIVMTDSEQVYNNYLNEFGEVEQK